MRQHCLDKSRGAGAFTLVELLVVISIIALLLSVLMPALSKAREQARKVVCGNGMRQVGIIQSTYASEYRQWLPRMLQISDQQKNLGINDEVQSVLPFAMPEKVYQYVKKSYKLPDKIFVCPSLASNMKTNTTWPIYDSVKKTELKYGSDPTYWGEYRWLGMFMLQGLTNMKVTNPKPDVPTSSKSPMDRGGKVLGSDITIVWNTWTDPFTRIAHYGKNGLPGGANRLYGDGSVFWNAGDRMTANERPFRKDRLDYNKPRYQHFVGERYYFW